MATNPTICIRIGEITRGALCAHVYPRDDGQSEVQLQDYVSDDVIVRVGDSYDSSSLTMGELRAFIVSRERDIIAAAGVADIRAKLEAADRATADHDR